MSWQEYVDDYLMCEIEGNHLAAAAIIGHDGTVWAQSAAFPQLKPGEITDIMNDFDVVGSLASTRIHLGGSKYKVIKGEAGTVFRGKEVFSLLEKGFRLVFPCFSTEGPSGVIVKKTGLAIIIGIYDGGMAPGQCNMIVEKLGEYLVDKGF